MCTWLPGGPYRSSRLGNYSNGLCKSTLARTNSACSVSDGSGHGGVTTRAGEGGPGETTAGRGETMLGEKVAPSIRPSLSTRASAVAVVVLGCSKRSASVGEPLLVSVSSRPRPKTAVVPAKRMTFKAPHFKPTCWEFGRLWQLAGGYHVSELQMVVASGIANDRRNKRDHVASSNYG